MPLLPIMCVCEKPSCLNRITLDFLLCRAARNNLPGTKKMSYFNTIGRPALLKELLVDKEKKVT